MKVIKLQTENLRPTRLIDFCVKEIESGERILISWPPAPSECGGVPDQNVLQDINNLNASYTAPYVFYNKAVSEMPPDVFFAVRCEDDMIVCDMYHV